MLFVVETIRLRHDDLVVIVDAVMVEERAARRLDERRRLLAALALGHEIRALQVLVVAGARWIISMACSSSIMRAQW